MASKISFADNLAAFARALDEEIAGAWREDRKTVTRLAIQNHWDPVTKRWTFDRGMLIDVGSTAAPNSKRSAALIVDAGEDFIEIEDDRAPQDPQPDREGAAPDAEGGARAFPRARGGSESAP